MYQSIKVDHLPLILSPDEISAFNFSPDIIWIFDLDRHGFWWGNQNALQFWGLNCLQDLIDKDLSADTVGARKRTEQTFVKAALEGQTEDPWTTYPNGKPTLMMMRHKAVLLGPDRHRGIIAFISEQVDTNNQPENLLFAEAVRYTAVAVSCYDTSGKRLFENPAFTACYGHPSGDDKLNDFERLFADQADAKLRLTQAQSKQEGCFEHLMVTRNGIKRHNVDIRTSRHPVSGDYVFLVTETDVTELHDTIEILEQTREKLKRIAHYDPLTQLPSIWLTKERLSSALKAAKREQHRVAVMFIDLDGFKLVNDSFGHSAGDELLTLVAKRLTETFRASDTVGRLGGDEFLICLPKVSELNDALMLAQKAIMALSTPFSIHDDDNNIHSAQISASVGIAYYPDDEDTPEKLISAADKKMYQAKRLGKNRFC